MTQANMQDLHRHLKTMNTIAPQMKAAVDAAREHDRRLAALETSMDRVYPAVTAGQQAQAEAVVGRSGTAHRAEAHQHAEAFTAWLRSPGDRSAAMDLVGAEEEARPYGPRASGNTGTGAAGGFSVPEPVADAIRQRILEISPMRRLATSVTVTSTGTKFLVNRNDATSSWIGETATRTDTTEPTLDLRTPTYGTVYGLIEATEELLLDSAIDVNGWFTNAVAQQIAQAEGAAFVSGDGSAKPTGLLSGPTPVTTDDATRDAGTLEYVPTGDAGAITVDSLTDLFFAPKAQHRQNGSWIMSSATGAALEKLKDADGRSIWQTSLSADTPNTLLGRPVVFDEHLPAIAGDAFPVAFGDVRAGYLIADSGGLRITVDDNLTKPGFIRFYFRRRVGGIIYDSEAVKLLKVATT